MRKGRGPAFLAGALLILGLIARAQAQETDEGAPAPHSLLPPSPPVTATPLAPPPGTAPEQPAPPPASPFLAPGATPPTAPSQAAPSAAAPLPASPNPVTPPPPAPAGASPGGAASSPQAGPTPTPPSAAAPAGTSAPPPAAAGPSPSPTAPGGTASGAPVVLPPDWEPKKSADLLVLDTLAGQARHVHVAVGASAALGTLSVSVPVCLSRPATEARDDAALVIVSEKGATLFQGWMFSAEPALGVLEHPIYDIRLAACE
jgi:hypothetical protein